MKMYQAVDETVCIKEFGPELLPGWFATTQEALAAFKQPESKTIAPVSDAPRRIGRPPKAK